MSFKITQENVIPDKINDSTEIVFFKFKFLENNQNLVQLKCEELG